MLEEMFDLEGKVAIVTGGCSGIGSAIAHTLGRLKSNVVIVDVTSEKGEESAAAIRNQGGHAWFFKADVSKEKDVKEAVEAVEQEVGPVDILVNSAGINIRKETLKFEVQEWDRIISVNLTGTFLFCQAVGRRMVSRRSGRIVNIASITSSIAIPELAPYCASKAGVSQLTKALALEWAPYGILVNAIGPGRILTPLTAGILSDPEFEKKAKELVPLGRIGEPEDLLGIVLVLCSKAGSYITGQTIYIDGGWSIW